jgi:UDP-GlcNAc:undecaprenyl-phosphate GlcNAc-1-phosphate transferase
LGYLLASLLNGTNAVEVAFLATGATVVFLVGYADDMRSLPPGLRFVLHLAAAAWAVLPISLPLGDRLLMLFWVAGATNAYNLIDGMDGLALSLSLVTAVVAMTLGNPGGWLSFAGMIAGVLVWNFPVARTFLGDGGSTFLGFVCASQLCWDLARVRDFSPSPWMLALLLFLLGGVPVADTIVAMTRRILAGRSPFLPDRGHAHHRLLDRGIGKGKVLAILAGTHLLFLAAGIFMVGCLPG